MDLTAQYRRHPMVSPLYDRLDAAEDRLGRIENALSAILNHLNLPKLSTFSPESPKLPTPSTSTPTPPSVPPKKDPYSYRPLDESQDEIRLLIVDNTTIQQGQDDKPITAELIHVSLNWKTGVIHHPAFGETKDIIPQYTSMSYTWGEPQFTSSIVLNGHIFPVTRNVETALRHMCKTKPGRKSCWWVDQICELSPVYPPMKEVLSENKPNEAVPRHQPVLPPRTQLPSQPHAPHLQVRLGRECLAGGGIAHQRQGHGYAFGDGHGNSPRAWPENSQL